MISAPRAHQAEIERIRAEYERRQRQLPPDYYDWNRPVNLFRDSQISRSCITALVREGMFPLQNRSVVDVGCGRGQWLAEFLQWGAESGSLSGIDLHEDRIESARKRIPTGDLRPGDACRLPWREATFDVATQFMLFSSVLDMDMKRQIASEMLRVLKPGGLILWYDLHRNNPQNPNVRGIKAQELQSFFPGCVVTLDSVTLAPPLSRWVVPVTWVGALLLEKVPLLRTHYLGVVRKQQ